MAAIGKFVDKAYEDMTFAELVKAPVSALQGMSESDGEALAKLGSRAHHAGVFAEDRHGEPDYDVRRLAVRDPVESLTHGALPRAMGSGGGRTVPLVEHIRTHVGAAYEAAVMHVSHRPDFTPAGVLR